MKITFSNKTKQILRKLGVGLVYLIGSRATGIARENSDIDFAVVMKSQKSLRNQENLYEQLYDIFSNVIPLMPTRMKYPENIINVDIVFLQTAPLYYAHEAIHRGKLLFEISPQFRADFAEQTMTEYADMEPIMMEHHKAVLARI